MYVEITDNRECLPDTKECILGVCANKAEWETFNFYPQSGMVGEIMKVTPKAYIIKIVDDLYVPISKKGIREISKEEYFSKKDNDIYHQMIEYHQRYNDFLQSILVLNMREQFKQDIIANIKILTWDFEISIYLPDLEKSCVIYATDMLLEYKQHLGPSLPTHVIAQVSEQVIDVYNQFFSNQFLQESASRCKENIKELLNNTEARNIVDDYYHRLNIRYSCHKLKEL